MPKKNRSYKKGLPHRDARLFVIVAEGEREDAYFRWFHPDTVCPLIDYAARHAREADNDLGHFPDFMKTKVYLLAEKMLEWLGRNWLGDG